MKLGSTKRRLVDRITLPAGLGMVGALIVILYGLFVALPFIQGPEVIMQPVVMVGDNTAHIEGVAHRVSRVSVNGMSIPISEQGGFSIERAYPSGYTVLTVLGEDRFGRTYERTITFIIEQHASKKEDKSREPVSVSESESIDDEGSNN